MKINPEQLARQLQNKLSSVYYVCGDETLLTLETSDAIRAAVKKQGIVERERFDTTAGFDLEQLQTSQESLSLFSEKKLVELHLHQVPSKALQEYLQENLEKPSDDILLITSGRLNVARQSWYQLIEKHGIVIECWPIKTEQLPQWLNHRLINAGFQTDPDALHYLASVSEGNLLAAKQTIEKLQLLCQPGNLDLKTVMDAVQDNARFDVFQLADSALAGQAKRCSKILQQLQAQGTAATLALWAITREIRTTLNVANNVKTAVWPSKKNLYQSAGQRVGKNVLEQLLSKTSQTDLMIKGLQSGNPWDALLEICVSLSSQIKVA